MRYRPLGQSGIEASVVALGAWAIGGWYWGGTDETQSIDAIHAALDAGINFIDTAPVYGLGRSEAIVGKAIAGRRDQVVIASKCGVVWHTQKGKFRLEADGKQVYRYLGAESIRYEIEESLRRLQTDYIDLYQTHQQDPTTSIEETMGILLELKEQGKIRAIGVSNETADHMEQYRKLGPVDSDQERYSILDQHIEEEQLPYCRNHGIAVLAFSPLEQGLLTGKVTTEREFPEDDLRTDKPGFDIDSRRRINTMLKQDFQPIADRHGLTLAQLAIAWTIAQPGLTHALVGARNPQQAAENAAAGDVVLSSQESAAMNQAVHKRGLFNFTIR